MTIHIAAERGTHVRVNAPGANGFVEWIGAPPVIGDTIRAAWRDRSIAGSQGPKREIVGVVTGRAWRFEQGAEPHMGDQLILEVTLGDVCETPIHEEP